MAKYVRYTVMFHSTGYREHHGTGIESFSSICIGNRHVTPRNPGTTLTRGLLIGLPRIQPGQTSRFRLASCPEAGPYRGSSLIRISTPPQDHHKALAIVLL